MAHHHRVKHTRQRNSALPAADRPAERRLHPPAPPLNPATGGHFTADIPLEDDVVTWEDLSTPDSVSTWHRATAWNSGPSAETGTCRVEIHGLEDLPERVQDEP